MGKKIIVFAGATYMFGAEKVTMNVIKGLQGEKYDITVLINGWNNGDFIKNLEINNIINHQVLYLGWYYLTKPLWSINSLLHYPAAFFKFMLLVKKLSPDIIYVTSYRPLLLLYPLIRKKVIYNVQDPNSESKQGRFFIRLVDKKVFKYTACSNAIKNDLIQCGINANKIEVVHNGVDVPINHNEALDQKIFKSITVGIVGQIIPRKGHEDVVEALLILKNKKIKLKLSIIGSGDERFIKHLKNLIEKYQLEDYVKWVGYTTEISEIYNSIDILIAPSRNNEPFALVVLEAGVYGKPVIVTNKGGFLESVKDGYNGFIVNANSPLELADKLLCFVDNPNLINSMGQNMKEKITTHFSNQIMIQKLQAVIES